MASHGWVVRLIAKAKEEVMGRLARSFLWAIAIGTSQLPLAFLTMAGDLDANTRPIIVVAQASPTPSKAKTSKAKPMLQGERCRGR